MVNNMKKSVFLLCFLLVILTACTEPNAGSFLAGSSSISAKTQNELVDNLWSVINEQQQNNEVTFLNAERDIRMTKIHSNVDICNTNCEYTEKMKQLINKYDELIINNVSDDILKIYMKSYYDWENYSKAALKNQWEYLNLIYTNGTIVPILYSQYEYNLYCERARELYDLCYNLELF